jgi:hypothetical protein
LFADPAGRQSSAMIPVPRWLFGLMAVPALCATGALCATARLCAAADLSPQDFAFGLPVTPSKDAAVYRFALPLDVYRGTTREDLGDLRVFNAQGEAVPYSLMRSVPASQPQQAATALPLYPLRGSARAVLDGVRISIDSPGSGAAVDLRQGGAAPAVLQYVLDGRGLKGTVAALQFNWPETAADYSGRVKIEASDDLDTWQTLVAAAPTANLHANGQALIENRVALTPTEAKFWRISWVGPPPRFELTSVLAEPADNPVESAHEGLEVEGTWNPAEADADLFDLGAHLPVSRVNVILPEANTVTTVELSSRRTAAEPWHTVTQAGFYRLRTPEGEQHNAILDVSVNRDRYWRARIVRGGGLQTPLRLRVEWIPNDVTFLARGLPPFLLAYGSGAVAGAEADLSQVPADVEIAAATVGSRQVLGGAGRLGPKAAPYPRARTVLWAALLLAVGLVGWLAARRFRDAGTPGGSAKYP